MNGDSSIPRSLLPFLNQLQQDNNGGPGDWLTLPRGPTMVGKVTYEASLRATLVVGDGEISYRDIGVGGVRADGFQGERAVDQLTGVHREIPWTLLKEGQNRHIHKTRVSIMH